MTSNLATRLEGHLAAIASTTLALTCIAEDARAAIYYSGVVHINIPVTVSGVYLNIANGTWSTSTGASVPGWDVNPWGASSLDMYSPTAIPSGAYVGSGTTYTNLPSLTLIDSASNFASGVNVTPDGTLNLSAQTNLIGFRFYNEALAQYHYGWMRLGLSSTLTGAREIVDYAYETNGGIITPFVGGNEPQGIRAGEIPTPASLTFVAIPGLATLKRRRRPV